jgi:serralysin
MAKLTTATRQYETIFALKTHGVVAASEYEDMGVYTVSAPLLKPLAAATTFNATFDWETTSGLPTHITDLIGTTVRDKSVLPEGDNVPGTVRWQIDAGWQQDVSDNIITFGFANTQHALGLNNNPSFGEGGGYTPFSEAQKAAARVAIANWDDLIAARFVEVAQGPGASSYGRQTTDIMLANTTTGPAQAWAYYPGYDHQYARVAGDVWIADPRVNTSNAGLLPGQYGTLTLNHELGHTLGLSHPGNYNFGDDSDGDGFPDPITYQGDAFYFQDSMQYSIMSYFDAFETGAQNIDWNVMRFVYASTPMVDDVKVIQQKYGADMTTRTGNTVYGFNSTADVKNEAMKFNVGEMAAIFTIWDAGGNDTLDLSGFKTDSVIDLREGAYSSAGGYGAYDAALIGTAPTLAQINLNNTAAGLGARNQRLFDIYFEGNYSDTNADGTKTLVNEGLSWKEITGTGAKLLMEQNIGIAYGAVIENAIGGAGNDRINGNQANNVFTGNGGSDTFIFANYSGRIDGKTVVDTSVDKITDFVSGTDKIDVSAYDANTRVAGDQAFTFIGSGAFTQVAGQLRTYSEGGDNFIAGDTNGDGIADFMINISHSTVVVADFFL